MAAPAPNPRDGQLPPPPFPGLDPSLFLDMDDDMDAAAVPDIGAPDFWERVTGSGFDGKPNPKPKREMVGEAPAFEEFLPDTRPDDKPAARPDNDRDSQRLKQRGNDAFAARDFPEAIALYSQALESASDELRAVLHSNLAAARLGLGLAQRAADNERRLATLYARVAPAKVAEAGAVLAAQGSSDPELFLRRIGRKYKRDAGPPAPEWLVTLEQAASSAVAALALDPGNAKAAVRQARALAALGLPTEAAAVLKRSSGDDPDPKLQRELRVVRQQIKEWPSRHALVAFEHDRRTAVSAAVDAAQARAGRAEVAEQGRAREREAKLQAHRERVRARQQRQREQATPCLFAGFLRLPARAAGTVLGCLPTVTLGRLAQASAASRALARRHFSLADVLRANKSVPRRELYTLPPTTMVTVSALGAGGRLVLLEDFGRITSVFALPASSAESLVRVGGGAAEELPDRVLLAAVHEDTVVTLTRRLELHVRRMVLGAGAADAAVLTRGPHSDSSELPVVFNVAGIGITSSAVVLAAEDTVFVWQRPSLRLVHRRAVEDGVVELRVCDDRVFVATRRRRQIVELIGQTAWRVAGRFHGRRTPLFDVAGPLAVVASRRELRAFRDGDEVWRGRGRPQKRGKTFGGFAAAVAADDFGLGRVESDSDDEESSSGEEAVTALSIARAAGLVFVGRSGSLVVHDAGSGGVLRTLRTWLAAPRAVVVRGTTVAMLVSGAAAHEQQGERGLLADGVRRVTVSACSVQALEIGLG